MVTLAGIFVFIKRRAVETAQTVGIAGKVRGHPVDIDADARLVQTVDQVHELLRVTHARGYREVARNLVAP